MIQFFSRGVKPFALWKAENGKTDMDLAAACRVHPQSINRWINGKAATPYGFAKLLAETIGKSVDDVFEERNVPARAPRAAADSVAAALKSQQHPHPHAQPA